MGEKQYDALDELLTPEAKSKLESSSVEVRAALRVAELLHQIMEEEGLNQKSLAERLGVSAGYVSRLLAGDENPSVKSVARMLHDLGRSYIQDTGKKSRRFDVLALGPAMEAGTIRFVQKKSDREARAWKQSAGRFVEQDILLPTGA